MRWQRHARIAVGVVGLACAVALFLTRRDRPQITPPPAIAPVDPSSLTEGGRGRILLLDKDGKTRGTLSFERSRAYQDGRQRFEVATLVVEQGDPFEVKAGVIETKGKDATGEVPDEIAMSSGLVLSRPSGLHIESETGVYRDRAGVMTMPGAVTFGRDRMTGGGTGATYRRDADTLELSSAAHVTIGPDRDGRAGLSATSGSMVLNRAEHALHLDGTADVTLESETFHATKASVSLSDDEQTVKQLRLLGEATVAPVRGAKAPGPSMTAEGIDLAFQDDGRTVRHATLARSARLALGRDVLSAPWIDLELAADGSTVTRLESREGTHAEIAATAGTSARTVDARTLVSTGTAKAGLTTAKFDGDVVFWEAPSADRGSAAPLTGKARTLVLALSGGLGAIDSADFQRDVHFTDGVVTADADGAVYDTVKDRLMLRSGAAGPKRRAEAQDARVHVTAGTVDINVRTHDLHAMGDVQTRTLPDTKAAAPGSAPAVFDRSKPVLGSAPDLSYVSASGRATYTGSARQQARVEQEKNIVTADEITLDDATGNLSARRRVDTTLEMAPIGSAAGAAPAEYRITSSEADFDQNTRRATFKGKQAALRTPDEQADADAIELRLAGESRTIETLTLAGHVFAQLAAGREALGDRLTLDAANQVYRLTGTSGAPALVKAPGEPGGPCFLKIGMALVLDQKRDVFRSDANGAVATTESIPCDTPLRTIRR